MNVIIDRHLMVIVIVLVSVAVSGCSWGRPSASEMLMRFPTPIYSLTGEKLKGPSCEDAQSQWLARVDQDGDGTIDLSELKAEAKRLFALMDLNHDGVITADELSTYRGLTADQPEEAAPPNDGQQPDDDKGTGKGKRERQLPNRPSSSQPDPVLAADANLRFQVTLDDFLAQQQENMIQFDKNKDGQLDAHELNLLCRIREQAASPTHR